MTVSRHCSPKMARCGLHAYAGAAVGREDMRAMGASNRRLCWTKGWAKTTHPATIVLDGETANQSMPTCRSSHAFAMAGRS